MKIRLIAAGLLVVACSGCGTVKQVDTNAWAKDYYNQPNVAPIMQAKGTNLTFTLTVQNASEFTMSTPVPTKSIIPRDPGVLDSLSGMLGNALPWIGAMYVGGKLADRPATVQQQVVRPEVVTMPAAAAQ